MKKQTKKQIEKQAELLFYEHGNRIQFNIMNLSKIMKATEQGLLSGTDGITELKKAIEMYREN